MELQCESYMNKLLLLGAAFGKPLDQLEGRLSRSKGLARAATAEPGQQPSKWALKARVLNSLSPMADVLRSVEKLLREDKAGTVRQLYASAGLMEQLASSRALMYCCRECNIFDPVSASSGSGSGSGSGGGGGSSNGDQPCRQFRVAAWGVLLRLARVLRQQDLASVKKLLPMLKRVRQCLNDPDPAVVKSAGVRQADILKETKAIVNIHRYWVNRMSRAGLDTTQLVHHSQMPRQSSARAAAAALLARQAKEEAASKKQAVANKNAPKKRARPATPATTATHSQPNKREASTITNSTATPGRRDAANIPPPQPQPQPQPWRHNGAYVNGHAAGDLSRAAQAARSARKGTTRRPKASQGRPKHAQDEAQPPRKRSKQQQQQQQQQQPAGELSAKKRRNAAAATVVKVQYGAQASPGGSMGDGGGGGSGLSARASSSAALRPSGTPESARKLKRRGISSSDFMDRALRAAESAGGDLVRREGAGSCCCCAAVQLGGMGLLVC